MPVTLDEARNYMDIVRETDSALNELAVRWDVLNGKTAEAETGHMKINSRIETQNALTAGQKRILSDSLDVTNSLLEQFGKLAPETRDWTEAISGALTSLARFATGDIVGGIVSAIQTVGEAISDVLGLGDKWQEQLDAVDDVFEQIGIAVEKSWTIMDKKVRAGKMTLDEELKALKLQQDNQNAMRLSEEQRLDLAIKIKDVEEKLYRQSVEKEKELAALAEARRRSQLDDIQRKISLGLIDVQNVGEAGSLAGQLSRLDYNGTALAAELQKFGVSRASAAGVINISQTNFGMTGAQAGEQIAKQISSATGGY
ncbi:MAG: hypothetical protein A2Y33_12290 [Spirochaetes bacterium GWF1_51_8]|nr:MAG: hypothetical protein A2Y33_12290 [Spirochaetes bacterium GWF1_51_8]